jgi:hypothetical protein
MLQDERTIELVIARYNEKLEWIKMPPFQNYEYIVYNKSDNRHFTNTSKCTNVIQLPNVGREPHTYLYHIIQNYDTLKDITVFLPGSVDSPNKYERALYLMYVLSISRFETSVLSGFFQSTDILRGLGGFFVDEFTCTNPNNFSINSDVTIRPSPLRPFGKWYQSMFGENKMTMFATYNSMIAIQKNDILQYPKSYYENLIRQIETHSNPEESHYFERAWEVVFYPLRNVKYV